MRETGAIKLPTDLVVRLRKRTLRSVRDEWDVVFPSPLGRLRDPSNTGHDVGDLLTAAGHEWATAHWSAPGFPDGVGERGRVIMLRA